MRNNLAPIVLFVYNRSWHTEQTLNALMQNELADQSILYIFADGPKENATDEQLEKIKETREIIRDKQWCKEVIIYEKEKNNGLANSIIEGVSEVISKFGKVIVLEDDIVTSPYFLKYMNDALNFYYNENKVKSISAYLESIIYKGASPFFLSKGSSWGWATWMRVWKETEWNGQKLLENLHTNQRIDHFNFSGYSYYQMLQDQVDKKIDSWAIRFYASCFLNNGLHLTPPFSLVKNIGFDGSGTHNSVEIKMSNSKILTEPITIKDIPLIANQKMPEQIRNLRENKRKTLKPLMTGFIKHLIVKIK